ncbi:tetratricopeptide repeat protein [uncultured Polaribacter sp.]|uniref:tetratricopeptide repeat protein n=1 Tax=uncultured Polaribacter sp. TaxID=174711 RepID=UPI00259B3B51|nr:tetratricopeptide repeat protein [uncultured Polaribacter sp.]
MKMINNSIKKNILLILFFTSIGFSQSPIDNELRNITGFIFHQNKPLSNVNITLSSNQKTGTTSNNKGFFSIKAKVGEILVFNYLGFKTVKIYIEDVTSVLNITMKIDNNMLDGISINTKKRKKGTTTSIKQREENLNTVLKLGRLNINTRSSGFGIKYINGNKLNESSFSLARAIRGLAPGLEVKGKPFQEVVYLRQSNFFRARKSVLWDVDGAITNTTPNLAVSQIKHIVILSSLGATNAYGADGAGGVIIISTNSDARINNTTKSNRSNYENNKIYNGKAIPYKDIKTGKPNYLKVYNNISNLDTALAKYADQYLNNSYKSNFHFNIFNEFKEKYSNKKLLLKVLADFEKEAASNVIDLKSIAYKYQELKEFEKAIRLYRKIANLRPNHAQSYRDLANAYLEVNDYKNAWKIYKFYLEKGYTIEENDIGEIIESEMIKTYINRKKDSTFKEIFKSNDFTKIMKSDVRLVFEWNTSEAEFILEFVNYKNQSYKVENSLDANNDLIIDQKQKGYTSKEFMIEKLDKTPYLVNIIYLGNKQYKPTILKMTTYYNWGKNNQSKEIEVFELKVKNMKIQLKKIDF